MKQSAVVLIQTRKIHCGSQVCISNLKRHILVKHPTKAAQLNLIADNENDDNRAESETEELAKENHLKRFRLSVNPQKIKGACVKLVTVHGLPLSIFNYEGFRKLTEDLFAKLDFKPNRLSCVKLIQQAASGIRSVIKNEVKNKLISLKIDITTRHGKHVLGISLQFFLEKKIVSRNVGMIEIFVRPNSVNIRNEIVKCLNEIQVSMNQVYAIAVDNARNMIATVDRIRLDQIDIIPPPQYDVLQDEDKAELQLKHFISRELEGEIFLNILKFFNKFSI